jgi:hypothetical protein
MATKKKGAKRSGARKGVVRRGSAKRRSVRRGSAKKRAVRRTARRVTLAPGTVFLIDMIPKSLSAESSQDSEPHLTVNPANTKQIVGTAFTGDPAGGPRAPVYVSADGGTSWRLNSIVPSVPGAGLGTGDITTSFSGKGTTLYGGILKAGNGHLEFLRTKDPFTAVPMTVLMDRPNADQPFTHATIGAGKERVYIGSNDFAATAGKTGTVDDSLNAGASTVTFNTVRVEKRTTLGQDGPQTRPATHSDGTVYAAFYRWRSSTGNFSANTFVITSADVIIVRDDNWGAGSSPFTALTDPVDGVAGNRVAQGVSFPFMIHGTAPTGQQRLGGSISVAVDPRSSSTVFLAWGDRQSGSVLTLHVRVSRDRGVTWSGDLLTVPNATNGSLAVNSAGVVGFLYQQIRGTGAAQRWVTHFRRSANGVNWSDLVLADTPATTPAKTFDPYLGDYAHLTAVNADFCGIFSANNTPDKANFPNGVVYQRVANFTSRKLFKLDGTSVVAPSIDPFFFRVS